MRGGKLVWILTGALALVAASSARAGAPVQTCFTSNGDNDCSNLTATDCGEWRCEQQVAPSPGRGSSDGICLLRAVTDGRECRGTSGNVCDVAEQCDGFNTECPSDAFEPPGTSCTAGNGPVGVGRTAIDECDPGDTCDGTGTCVDNTLGDGSPCDDFNGCTQTDTCQGGSCTGGDPVVCNPSDQCHDAGTCEPSTGLCSDPPAADTTPCDDGNACTQTDECQTGVCTGGNSVVCNALDQCHDAGTCDPQTGVCDDPAKPDGTSCDDSNACTTTDTCAAGVCTGAGCPVCGNGVVEAGEQCDDGNVAPSDGCDGSCQLEGTPCSTDDDCTPDPADCADNLCNTQTGFCETTFLTSECRPAANDCDAPESCDGASPDCPSDLFVDDGTACGDSTDTECNAADTCLSGACEPNLAAAGTACGDPNSGACTDPDSCDDSGTCLPNHLECGLVTGGGTCLFDKYPGRGTCTGGTEDCSPCAVGDSESACVLGGGSCDETRDFRLIFTPDVKLWPAHKLNASNAGQHWYNLFVEGTAGEEQTVTIEVPFPFVTQGANPVHAYDAFTTGQDGECFAPSDEIPVSQAWVALADWSDGTQGGPGNLNCDAACGPLTCATEATCTFDVTFTVPESGMTYVQVHLDYGLKGVFADGNPCDTLADRYDPSAANSVGGRDALENNSTQDGAVRIADGQAYDFAHFLGSDPEGGDTVHSANEFKRIAGVLGLATKSADGSGVAGATIELIRSGKVVAKSTTDADGFYALGYKHKGKAATFTVRLKGERTLTQQVTLKANGWAEVNFDLSTGAASSQFGSGTRK